MFWQILISCFSINGIAFLLGQSSIKNKEFYHHLVRPDWSPPSYLFGIVWPILYTLMGYALYRIYSSTTASNDSVKKALLVFAVQYLLNVIWSPIFFGRQDVILASLVITALIPFIIWTMVEFYSIDKISSILLIPYLFWVSFATTLTYSILNLNFIRA